MVYPAGQDFNMSMLRAVIWVEYNRACVLYGRSNNLKFIQNSDFFSQSTTSLFNKSATFFVYCFVVTIRPIPRI